MAQTFKYVQGDTGPQLKISFTDDETGEATDLTGATAKLHFRATGEDTVLFSRNLVISESDALIGAGIVVWNATDLEQEAGSYEGEVEVVLANGVRETLYDTIKFKIREDFA